ncbi:MAG: aminotransferase class I/II-fold pyridoxal phosphate-dependent enzyme [Cyclobacteriaceae bacterium]|jgi:8-amino-3,8-dideoxy-alpha-D-manno-octulosonate transaminase|nr:aminotransferase class I/II-fold pyridoxal phosphate-dependent enzyme [Cyclobacteriaceae bacterium]MDH4295447.1 aminotransferase class I/II-fold pyridoxal phosphate-dependent enzyme [Cyclobacteriaceae bacterium]MDH5249088.1 aminotransferase class I/II-fold pyridoxal phosphate-dependent enzyme [Cyclobacteriaceae bacterium]
MPGTELFGAEERKEVNDVLETGILFRYNHENQRNNIWKARDFEAEVRKVTGAEYAHAVSSGSTAVACALAAAGVGAGDEVIIPPFTYVASNEAVLFCGALPVFAEIDETLCLSAEGIRKAITPKTKAVLLVHMCGQMARMDEIMKVVQEHNLILVEDAGQAFGASFQGKAVGLFGKTGCYSFDFFKIATCGEGGVMVTQDKQCYLYADSYSDHGHDHIGGNRGMESHPILGFNYRIGEINAAIGLAQTRRVPMIVKKNNEHKLYLTKALSAFPGISFAALPDPAGDSGTFLNMFFEDTAMAGKVVKQFNADGVTGFNYWYTNMYHFINQWDHLKGLKTAAKLPIHLLGAPQDYQKMSLAKSQEVVGRLVSFGIRVTWTKDELDSLVAKITKSVKAVQIA